MKNPYAFLAAAFLFLGTNVSRSQDAGMTPRPVAGGVPAALDTAQPTPGAKCQTLQQRLEEWAKMRPVSQMVAAPVESAPSPAYPESGPSTPASPIAAPLNPWSAPCLVGPRHRSLPEQLGDWLTYRPLSRDVCDCCLKCVPCCDPPLYAFFIGNCCINPAGAGCRTPCARCGSCGCGHRLADLCDRIRNCRLWPGRGDGHFSDHLSDLFFYHSKSCAPGACVADDNAAEKQN